MAHTNDTIHINGDRVTSRNPFFSSPPIVFRTLSAGQRVFAIPLAALRYASPSCVLDPVHGLLFYSPHVAERPADAENEAVASSGSLRSHDLASVQGHSSGPGGIEQGSLVAHENRRDKSPSPPPSQGNEPNAKYGSPNLTRLKVKYRQADDDHPVLAGVRGPRDPNSAVEKLTRDSGYSGDAARQYDYEPTHPFHVLNRDLIWFEVLDSVPGKPCNPSCRGTIHFGRYQRGEIHYGSISQRSEVHGVAGAMCSLGQVGMVRGEEEVLGGEGLMLDVVHLKSM
ncbi:hypothetical protein FB446DRAFT_782749 [Lentinula raphanica]|nr:hypothetical protein FB446DRAFT_782749 [Lentinula raphanica]